MKFSAILCGCGAMSKGWLRAIASNPDLADSITIVGLVDLNRETAEKLAAEFGLDSAVIGSNLSEVIAATKADLVFDIVIPAARHDVVSTALKAGCHVLSEKPMAASLAEGAALIDLAAETGRIHAVIQNRRFISGIRRLRRFVDSGAIGELTAIHCDFFLAPHFGGFREEMDNVLLLDMAIHTFDAARYVADRKPLTVYCVERNPKGSWYRHGASANAIFEFSDDIVFTYRGSWCAEGERTSWESQWRLGGEFQRRRSPGEEARPFARLDCCKRSRSGTRCRNPRPCQRHRRFHRRDPHWQTSRNGQFRQYPKASPWSSAPSKAPRPAGASKFQHRIN